MCACALGPFGGVLGYSAGCSGWEPSEPFERNSPVVDRALAELDAGTFEGAADLLQSYLGTGPCADAKLGLPDAVRQKFSASFDLGLALFYLAEQYGERFGEEDGRKEDDPALAQQDKNRSDEIDCAQVVAKAIASDDKVPIELRARAYYLSGNLEFLRRRYEEAVRQYDKAIELVPGIAADAEGDGLGRDAAWNRAIALRRIRDQRDAGQDADEPDSSPDSGPDSGDSGDQPDAGDDGGSDDGGNPDGGGDDGGDDGGNDGGDDGGDAGPDGGDDEQNAGPDGGDDGGDDQPDAGEDPSQPQGIDEPEPSEPPSGQSQLDRILDELEEAAPYQQEQAKKEHGGRRRVMEDK